MEPFVCVNLFGGLGNQLFQYAAGKTVAKQHNCTLYVNKETENAHNTNGHNYAKELFTDAVEVDWPTGPLGEYVFRSQGVNIVSQADGFSPWDSSFITPPCVLNGYFQYYPAIQNTIPMILDRLHRVGPKYPDQKATFLHIRRGDYVQKADFHYLQGVEYYRKAIEHIQPTKILVFSDDIGWCKEQSWLTSNQCLEFVDEPDEIKSLFLMASCKEAAILANSTFSWWAAMLSGTQKVVYPSKWIAQQIYSLFPPTWTAIET
jgi:hypothetical protein